LVTSTDQELSRSVTLPEGVTAKLEGRKLSIKGKLGTANKDFHRIHVELSVEGNKLVIKPFSTKRIGSVIANTVSSIISSMVKGVTNGYTYRLKVVYAHFPISVKVKGQTVLVENFVGERSPRVANIVGECKVTIEGDDIVIKGVSIESVGQTAANVEQATKIRRKDQRIFLDGVYIYDKKVGW
jgi:large subunit ribosomal protein L6